MKTALFLTALALAAAPAAAQVSGGAGAGSGTGSAIGGGSALGGGSSLGTTSPSMSGGLSNNPSLPSPTIGGSPANSPLSGVPGNPLGATSGNSLGRTPSSIPSGVGAGLNQNSTASGLPTPGAPVTDAGRPAGAPLGGADATPGTPN